MEYTSGLMIDFVKKLKIVDKEFRATNGAMDHALKQWDAKKNAREKELSDDVKKLAGEQGKKASELTGQMVQRLSEASEAASREKQAQMDELVACRSVRSSAAVALMSVVHKEELEKKHKSLPSVSVNVTDLLGETPNFSQLAVEVNTLYRDGKTGKAAKAYAQLRALAAKADEVLQQHMNTLRAGFADGIRARHEQFDKEKTETAERLAAWQSEVGSALAMHKDELSQRIRENAGNTQFDKLELNMKKEDRNHRIADSFQMYYPAAEMEEEYNRITRYAPVKNGYVCAGTMPECVYLADMEVNTAGLNFGPETTALLNRYYPFLFRHYNLVMPYGVPFDRRMNSVFRYGEKERAAAVGEARNLALRLYMAALPGKLSISFADPQTLGESFAMFGRLVYDRQEDNVIGGQIWSSQRDIQRRLEYLADHIADVTQRCLQGRYDSLADYNRDAYAPEGYHVLLMMDYPAGMTAQSMKLLEQIARLGPKCGVFMMLMRSNEQYQKADAAVKTAADKLEQEFAKWNIGGDLRVTFDGAKLPGGDVAWRSSTDMTAEETDRVLAELRRGIYGV